MGHPAFGVAVNRAKDCLRSFWRRNTVGWETYMEELPFTEPEDKELFESVMELPPRYRVVVHLFYYEEYSLGEVEYLEDGTVWVYYRDQGLEITDLFDENGVCFVQLKSGGKTQYLTVKWQNGYASSPNGFVQPETFN